MVPFVECLHIFVVITYWRLSDHFFLNHKIQTKQWVANAKSERRYYAKHEPRDGFQLVLRWKKKSMYVWGYQTSSHSKFLW